MTVPPVSIAADGGGATRRPAYLPHASRSREAPFSLEDECSAGSPFRLVMARDKRDRLARRAAGLGRHCACSVAECAADGMPVVLVDSEQEAVLCPVHQLVLPDGSAVPGQPTLVTAAW